MATQNVTASLQGRVGLFSSGVTNWLSQVRNATTGNSANTFTSSSLQLQAIRATLSSGRSGTTGVLYRTFLFFDTSSVPGTITSANLQIYGYSSTSSDAFIVKSTAWGGNGSTTTLTTAMYNDLDFSTTYSNNSISNWSTSTTTPNQFGVNGNAVNAMNNDGYLNVALINYSFDYGSTGSGTTPINPTNVSSGVRFKNTTYPIRLVITYTPGYANDIIGVNPGKVLGVSEGDILEVIGV